MMWMSGSRAKGPKIGVVRTAADGQRRPRHDPRSQRLPNGGLNVLDGLSPDCGATSLTLQGWISIFTKIEALGPDENSRSDGVPRVGRDARPQELPYSNKPSPRYFTVPPDDDADR